MRQQITGLFELDLETDGRTTIVTARPSLNPFTIAPQFGDGLEGVGIARCRREDRFNPEIGTYLAASRAIANLVEQTEARALAAVETEQQALFREMGEDIADGVSDLIDSINEGFRRAGLGSLVVQPR